VAFATIYKSPDEKKDPEGACSWKNMFGKNKKLWMWNYSTILCFVQFFDAYPPKFPPGFSPGIDSSIPPWYSIVFSGSAGFARSSVPPIAQFID
jgi:hypothetical protein